MIFSKARDGKAASPAEEEQFASYLMLFFGRLDAEKNWTKQLHLGALRNVNTRATQALGPNTGYDNIGDWPQAEALSKYLDLLEQENALPKTIIYNNNPIDNFVFSTAIGSFQDGKTPGKIQFGSGWWFLDQKEGIEWQLNALSNNGLFGRFVGMLTDSRSFMSFPRHEYFRRVLCNLLGNEIDRGELPHDEESGRHNNPQHLLRKRERISSARPAVAVFCRGGACPAPAVNFNSTHHLGATRLALRPNRLTSCASSHRASDSPASTPADTDTSPPASHQYRHQAPAHRPDT